MEIRSHDIGYCRQHLKYKGNVFGAGAMDQYILWSSALYNGDLTDNTISLFWSWARSLLEYRTEWD